LVGGLFSVGYGMKSGVTQLRGPCGAVTGTDEK